MGLDPATMPKTSPSQRVCKPKPLISTAPAKKVLTGVAYIHLYSKYAMSDEVSFLLLPCSDDEHVAVHAVQVVGASEGWEKLLVG